MKNHMFKRIFSDMRREDAQSSRLAVGVETPAPVVVVEGVRMAVMILFFNVF